MSFMNKLKYFKEIGDNTLCSVINGGKTFFTFRKILVHHIKIINRVKLFQVLYTLVIHL